MCDGKRKWDYELISVESTTSDPDKLFIDVRIKRMRQGDFAYHGYINFNYDVDDTTMVEAVSFRSQSGRDDEYSPMPWSIPKQLYTEFIESFYEDMIYKNLGGCSNMPKPENVLPFKKENITLTECVVSGDGLPEMAPQGYYKVKLTVTGEVEWTIVSVAKIFDKMMP
ncbi:hypothetical protein ACLKA7_013191 [Drosophila subpalustris]